MADVICIMKDGRIEQIGRPLDVYDRPANLFVAEFIGSPAMNMLRGEVAAENGRPVLRSGGLAVPLPDGARVTAGQSIGYGIRPEHLRVSAEADALAARVSIVEPTGPEIHIYADVAGIEVCAVTADRVMPTPGAPIGLAPQLDRVHLFDQASGQSLHG